MVGLVRGKNLVANSIQHLKNDFLISFSIKWWGHKTLFEETPNPSLLFCLFIRLHQRLIPEGNEGNLKKMYAISCVFIVVECIRKSKSCTFFTSLSLFCCSRRKRLRSLFNFCLFFHDSIQQREIFYKISPYLNWRLKWSMLRLKLSLVYVKWL